MVEDTRDLLHCEDFKVLGLANGIARQGLVYQQEDFVNTYVKYIDYIFIETRSNPLATVLKSE